MDGNINFFKKKTQIEGRGTVFRCTKQFLNHVAVVMYFLEKEIDIVTYIMTEVYHKFIRKIIVLLSCCNESSILTQKSPYQVISQLIAEHEHLDWSFFDVPESAYDGESSFWKCTYNMSISENNPISAKIDPQRLREYLIERLYIFQNSTDDVVLRLRQVLLSYFLFDGVNEVAYVNNKYIVPKENNAVLSLITLSAQETTMTNFLKTMLDPAHKGLLDKNYFPPHLQNILFLELFDLVFAREISAPVSWKKNFVINTHTDSLNDVFTRLYHVGCFILIVYNEYFVVVYDSRGDFVFVKYPDVITAICKWLCEVRRGQYRYLTFSNGYVDFSQLELFFRL